jgi:hypothetical protein
MRQRIAMLISFVMFGSLIFTPSLAATKAGAACNSKGQVKTLMGKKFTCVKSGKKLIWNKGVVVIKPTPITSPAVIGSTPTPTPTATSIPSPITTEPCVPLPPRTYPTVIPSLTVISDKARYLNVTIDVATPNNVNRNAMIARLKCQKIENASVNVWFKSKYDVINGLFTSSDWVMDTFGFSIIDAQGELQLPYTYRLEIPVPEDFLGGAGKIRADFATSLKQITGYNSGPYSNFVEFIP